MIEFTVPAIPVAQPRARATAIGRGAKKASDEQLAESYSRTGSVWKTAKEFGMVGQSVHERLMRLGVDTKQSPEFSQSEIELVRDFYTVGFKTGDGTLKQLAEKIGKSTQNISRWARRNKLTNKNRKCSQELSKKFSEAAIKSIKKNGHPRGALGMKHTSETKSKISKSSKELAARRTPERESLRMLKALKTRESNGTLYPPKHGNWKSDWRDIGGKRKYFRSRWEANYARYLEFLKQNGKIKDWEHEPKTFWFEKILRGVRSYLPDFLVTELDGSERYFEVKGWMDPKSITKIKRMAKYYPDVVLVVVDSKAYKALAKQVGGFIKDWE